MRDLFITLALFASFGLGVRAETDVRASVVPTLDEKLGSDGFRIGLGAKDWPAETLVGSNCGSVFFDVVFDEAKPPLNGNRSILCLRTNSRLRIGWTAYGNKKLQFTFSDLAKTYLVNYPWEIELGRTYALGCTWDGEVVRLYVDGRVVHSSVQPLPVKAKVTRLYAGPFDDRWIAPKAWADDVRLFRVRTWNVARTAQEVAAESGVTFANLWTECPATLTVPVRDGNVASPVIDGKLDDKIWESAASLPQLIRGNFVGKSGEMPPHGFRLAYDADNLYLATSTLFPGRIPYLEGLERTAGMEPEVWGTESWEFYLEIGGHRFRFAASPIGGTTESMDGDKKWNGEWKYASLRSMNIDDSVLWIGEAAIPWKTLQLAAPPDANTEAKINFCRSWTLSNFGGHSSLNVRGTGYGIVEGCPTVRFGPCASYRLEKRTDPADGEYAETYSLASARNARLTYEVALARRDGAFAPLTAFSRSYEAKAGEALTDALKIDMGVPGYDAIVHTLWEDGRIVMRESVPYDVNPEVFTMTKLLLQGRLRIQCKKPLVGRFVMTGPDGSIISETPTDGGALEIPFASTNPVGAYAVKLLKPDGTVVDEKKFNYPGVGDWARQDFHEDWILPPFAPLRTAVGENEFGCALSQRVYGWRKSFLPSRIKSVGEDLFVAPMVVTVDGVAADCTSLQVVSNARHHVGFEARGTAGGASVVETGWVEYDGVSFSRFVFTATEPAGEVCIRAKLRPELAKYLHAAAGSGWGAKRTEIVRDGISCFGKFPCFWIGNEEKGLCLFYESRAGWTASEKKVYEVEKTADACTVTLHVMKGIKKGETVSFECGFVASPVRPLSPTYPFDTLGHSYASVMNRPGRRPVNDVSELCSDGKLKRGDLGSFYGDIDDPMGRATDKWIRTILAEDEKPEYNSRPVIYTCSRHLSVKYPEVEAYVPEWTFKPEVALDYNNSGHFVYDCCPVSSANDFALWKARSCLKRYPQLKGFYFDFGTVHECSNADHGCRERTPLLGMREFYRRHIVIQVEAGITNPVVVLHNTDCVQLPAMTFATHLLNGEHVRQMSSPLLHGKKDILDTYGIEMFACELSTLPWGISNSVYMPYDTLLPKFGGDEKTEPYQFRMGKASIGACLLHNTMQCIWRNHFGIFDKVIRFYDDFGVNTAKFIGYWREPAKVCGADDVKVSCYTDGVKVLAVIAQLGKAHHDQDVEIELDLGKLGLSAPPKTAKDKMTAPDPDYDWLQPRLARSHIYKGRVPLALGEFGTKVLSFDGRVLKYHLPFHTFGIVEFLP